MHLLLEMSICSAAFFALFIWLYEGKNNHQFNRFYLLTSLLFSIGIPLVDLPVFPQYVVSQFVSDNQLIINDAIGGKSFVLTWEMSLMLLWILGVFLNLLLLLKSVISLLEIVKSSEKEREKDHIKIFTNNEMAVSSFLTYLFIPQNKKETVSDYEISHELTHILQKHSLDILFVECVKAILWFNPIVYFHKKKLIEIHEFLADENTSNTLGKEAYETFLIRQITTRQQVNLVHNFYSLFKKRLIMMQSNIPVKKWQYWAIIPIFLFCVTIFSCENYKVEKKVYPAIPAELVGEAIDTIITFDPETKEETIKYVKREEATGTEKVINDLKAVNSTGIDTIIVFDPADFTETVIIVNHDTGAVDTIQ